VAVSIAAALNAERGPIRIVGHTDNVKPKKTSAFKSNFDLSVARAQSVEKMIAAHFSDPTRTKVEGKGEDEPIADNATPEGRAKNRRVDVMIPREETL
jgi:type VI secretion system protein ImpK